MKITRELFEAAQEVRKNARAGSPERQLADAVLASYRPKRRSEAVLNEDVFHLFVCLTADGFPKMQMYDYLAQRANLSAEQVRRIVRNKRREYSGHKFYLNAQS